MNLVNLEGLTLIGPGSEWFWAIEAYVGGLVRTSIQRSHGAIHLAEELRAVVVRPRADP